MVNWTEATVEVAGTELALVRGGSGAPLLMLHDELGYPGWVTWNDALAQDRELIIPLQPGFGKNPSARLDPQLPRPGWVLRPRPARDESCPD